MKMKYIGLFLMMMLAFGISQSLFATTITQTVSNVDWNSAMWGTPAAAPASGNDYISDLATVRIAAAGSSSTFGGDSLTVISGTKALIKLNNGNTATINGNLILGGGFLTHGPNANSHAILDVTQLVIQSDSDIGCANVGLTLTIDGTLTGSGDITIVHDGGSAGGTRKVVFNAISNYVGTINVTEGMDIGFGEDYTFSSPLSLSDGSVLTVDHTFVFAAGDLIGTNGAVAAGIYTGSDITALGGNFADGGGTLIIDMILQTVGNQDWNNAVWGTPFAVPSSGNDYVTDINVLYNTLRIAANGASSTFLGDSLAVVSDTKALLKLNNGNTATINGNLILAGGFLTYGPNANSHATLDVTQLVIQSDSDIGCANSGLSLTIDGRLTGSGDITIEHDGGSAGGTRKVVFNAISNYVGTINVTEGMDIGFGEDYSFSKFLILSAGSVLTVDHTFTFVYGDLTTSGTAVASGTYAGATITALGSNFVDGGGTLVVKKASRYVTEIISQSPTGYWSFNESSGKSIVLARVGPETTRPLTIVGGDASSPTLRPPSFKGFGTNNTAYSFDNTSAINFDKSLASAAQGSVSFWFRKNSDPDGSATEIMWYAARVANGNGSGNEDEMHVDIKDGGKVNLFIDPGLNLETTGSYNDDIWHHVAATWDNSSTKIYIDGGDLTINGETVSGSASPATWTFDYIHSFGGAPSSIRRYSGKADELAVWDTVLTAEQVKEQYLAAIGTTGTVIVIK